MILKAVLLQVERVYVCVYVYISYMIQLVEMIDNFPPKDYEQ